MRNAIFKAKLESLEKQSLSRFCSRFNLSVKEFKQSQQQFYENKWLNELAALEATYGKEAMIPVRTNIEKAPNDYWSNLHYWTELAYKADIIFLLRLGDRIPVNEAYVFQLLNAYGLPISRSKSENVRMVLENTPALIQFDLECNAYVEIGEGLNESPIICIYPHFLDSLNYLSDMLLHSVLTLGKGGTFEFREEEYISQVSSSNMLHLISCVSILQRLIGVSRTSRTISSCAFSVNHPQRFAEISLVRDGAKGLIKFHEIGHLLLGHLEQPPSPSLELAADSFAAVTLILGAETEEQRNYYYLGMAILFSVLEILEDMFGYNSITHPSAQERIKNLVEQLKLPVLNQLIGYFRLALSDGYKTLRHLVDKDLTLEDLLKQQNLSWD
ncbi:MAG TPA: hypothetical protein VLR90_11995 [Blastocatellia bacterium]|nr:hypothetical protein [Blastocatellia bacterium]